MTNTQEAFEEAYCKALHLPKLKFAVDENGQYLDRDSQFCYEIWQSCQSHNDAVIAELLEVLQNIADEYLITGLYSQAEVKRDIYGDILILDHEKPVINIVEKLDNVIEKHKKGTT